ncbi:O-antigen ligase family protein [Mucilaginibacter sp. RS28]|uniref:O-antigen ligase family protein n=1 Tax=Mucilaginibacter straminoryzae TaxID=2932774 RepID=A0A9X1X5P4_9SPHI|nr:O-antigen ligase family protein [Mucilaginibacter straminoryzae]MCJ8211026.1 O-antigen ligase family protein [Mucilaginibacter straminoryzae]
MLNKVIRLWRYEFLVWEFAVIVFTFLAMEGIFNWLLMPISIVELMYEKLLSIAIFGFVLYKFRDLTRGERIMIFAVLVMLVRLVIESLIKYGTVMQEFTMYTILYPVIFTVYIKWLCRTYQLDFLPFVAKFYIWLYIGFMIIYGRGFSFSLNEVIMDDYGPFSGDSRIIHARSIFMMIIPMLWYLMRSINRDYKGLVPFAICVVVILIHQHRSVWASSVVALIVFLFAAYRNHYISFVKLFKISMAALILLVGVWFIVSSTSPKMIDFFEERGSEILNPTREGGTGEFRAQQRLVYFQYVLQRPVFGWTFEGFEMPNPLVDWWPAKSGQHFHEGYMEMLFYEGIAGLILKYAIAIYMLVKAFSKRLSQESVVLVAFGVAGMVFSFSYVLPLIYYGMMGLGWYYIEKDAGPAITKRKEEDEEQREESNDNLLNLLKNKQPNGYLQ